MRFLVDAQLPPALARWISANGHDAQHVSDFAMAGSSDHMIWRKAAALDAVVITKDEDFLHISLAELGPAIVWVTMGNTRRVELLARFEKALPEILIALKAGERVVELR
jgi:predicted nuclease of predicted toxin-antitoxin system